LCHGIPDHCASTAWSIVRFMTTAKSIPDVAEKDRRALLRTQLRNAQKRAKNGDPKAAVDATEIQNRLAELEAMFDFGLVETVADVLKKP
jgi:hypothetical protein